MKIVIHYSCLEMFSALGCTIAIYNDQKVKSVKVKIDEKFDNYFFKTKAKN